MIILKLISHMTREIDFAMKYYLNFKHTVGWCIENRGKAYSKHLFSFWIRANVEIVLVQSRQSNHSEQWAVDKTNPQTAIFCLKENIICKNIVDKIIWIN